MKKRIRALSALLCIMMLVSLFPAAVFAEEGAEPVTPPEEPAALAEAVGMSEDPAPTEGLETEDDSALIAEDSAQGEDDPADADSPDDDSLSLSEDASEEQVDFSEEEESDAESDAEEEAEEEPDISTADVVRTQAVALSAVTGEAEEVLSTGALLSGTFSIPDSDGGTYAYGITVYLGPTKVDSSYSYAEEELDAYSESFEVSGLLPNVTYAYQAAVVDQNSWQTLTAGELKYFTTAWLSAYDTISSGESRTIDASDEDILLRFTAAAAGDYVFSAAGDGSAYIYTLSGEELAYFDVEDDVTITVNGGESFWISCSSEGSFTITVTSFTSSVTECSAVTGTADLSADPAVISGTFTIPYQAATSYAYGIVLYLNDSELDSVLKYTAAEVNARTERFAFPGLVPGVTYEYRAVVREADAASNAAEGELCRLTVGGADGAPVLTVGQETALSKNTFYSFTAAETGSYKFTVSGQGEASLYGEDGSMLSRLGTEAVYLEAEEEDIIWIYCSSSGAGSPLSVTIVKDDPVIDSFYAITGDDAAAGDTTVTLSGEFNIPYRAGSEYAYGVILYLNDLQADSQYNFTKEELVSQVFEFTFTNLLPNIRYTYVAVIRDRKTGAIIADGSVEEFTTGSGSSVVGMQPGVPVGLDAAAGKTLLKFLSPDAGDYVIRLDGEGSVFVYGADGERKAILSSNTESILTLTNAETVWLSCEAAAEGAVQVSVTRFYATVTECSAETLADPAAEDTSAVLSGTFRIPYRADTTYEYGILLYLNGEQIDSALQTTSTEAAGLTVPFEFTGLVPEAIYSYKAVVMEQGAEEYAAHGEEKTFRTSSPGPDVKVLTEGVSISPLETYAAELYRFIPSDGADYKISTTGRGAARILGADGTLLGETNGEARIRVPAAGQDVIWLSCTNYSEADPFTLVLTALSLPAGSFSAVTEETAVTEKSVTLRIGFSIPFAEDTSYDYGVTLYANGRFLDSLHHTTGDELNTSRSFTFNGLLPNISYQYRVTIVEHETLEAVFTGEEVSFTTADGLSVRALTPGETLEVISAEEAELCRFTCPEDGYYRITVEGGTVSAYNVQGELIETYDDGAEDLRFLEAGEVLWLYCRSSEESVPLRFTIEKFEATVFDCSVLTGDATEVTDTGAVISATFSIPFDPDRTFEYGIEVFTGSEYVVLDYRDTGIEMDNKTISFAITGLVPDVTYSYQAVIYDPEADDPILAGEIKQFHTGKPSEEIPVLSLWEPYSIGAAEAETLLQFLSPEHAEYTFVLSGEGSAELFSEAGKRIADLNDGEDATVRLAAGEAVWFYCNPYGRGQTLTVMGWTADEARVVGDVPDGLWAVVYDPGGEDIASFARMDAGEERRLTIQSTGSDLLNEITNTFIDIPYFSYTGKAISPVIHLYNGSEQLDSKSYSISYKNNVKASSEDAIYNASGEKWSAAADLPQIIVKLKGNFSGTKTLYFNIDPIDISECIPEDIGLIWTGKLQKVAPKLVLDGKSLKIGTDYSISIAQATDRNGNPITSGMTTDKNGKFVQLSEAGTYTLSFTGKGNYCGETACIVSISENVVSISKAAVSKLSAQNYTGEEITPPISVTYNKQPLTEGTEYALEFTDNILPGTATVRVIGIEANGFTGSKTLTFKINPMGKLGAVAGLTDMTYTGDALEQTGFLVYSGTDKTKSNPLTEGTDYAVRFEQNRNAGTAKVILEGINGYKGSTLTKTFKIVPANLTAAAIPEIPDTVYSKAGAVPDLTVSFNGWVLKPGTDYTVKYANNSEARDRTAAKAPTVTITGKGNFTGTVSKAFTIVPKDIGAVDITAADVIWSGKPNKYAANVSLTDGGKKLAAGTDYEKALVYRLEDGTILDRTSPALAEWTSVTVTVSARGNNYTGSTEATYRIIPKTADIAKAAFKIADKEYMGTGAAVTLDASDILQSTINKTEKLQFGTDFVIESYFNNFNKGSAKVTFRGIGDYGGSKTVSFKIIVRDASAWWQRFFD